MAKLGEGKVQLSKVKLWQGIEAPSKEDIHYYKEF